MMRGTGCRMRGRETARRSPPCHAAKTALADDQVGVADSPPHDVRSCDRRGDPERPAQQSAEHRAKGIPAMAISVLSFEACELVCEEVSVVV